MNSKLVLAVSTALFLATSPALAENWKFLPGKDADFSANQTLSVMVGSENPDVPGIGNDSIAGMELSFDCPLLQPVNSDNKIRQQVSLNNFNDDVLELTSLEINPHYVINTSSGIGIGFGPGIGYIQAETTSTKKSMFALQAGASLHYTTMDFLFIGAEARYQFTESDSFISPAQKGIDNFRVTLKVGVNF